MSTEHAKAALDGAAAQTPEFREVWLSRYPDPYASLPTVSPAVLAVMGERLRQDDKWGQQDHDDAVSDVGPSRGEDLEFLARHSMAEHGPTWAAILLEEVGEALQVVGGGSPAALRAELVQVAAVAVAWIEALDRRTQNIKEV